MLVTSAVVLSRASQTGVEDFGSVLQPKGREGCMLRSVCKTPYFASSQTWAVRAISGRCFRTGDVENGMNGMHI